MIDKTKLPKIPGTRGYDLTGIRFSKLVVLKRVENLGNHVRWLCQCDCGNTSVVSTTNLLSGHTTSCGCARKTKSGFRGEDITGMKFGRWTVLGFSGKQSYWTCQCECGTIKDVYKYSLLKGVSTSCGCYNKECLHARALSDKNNKIGKRFGKLLVIDWIPNKGWLCQCDCGNTTIVKARNLTSGNTQSCGCLRSKGEEKITKLLLENNIPFETQYKPNIYGNGKMAYDFFVDGRYLLEFDGPQHKGVFSGYFTKDNILQIMERDIIKNRWALEHGIPLYRIPYNFLNTLTIDDLDKEEFKVIEEGKIPQWILDASDNRETEEAQEEVNE